MPTPGAIDPDPSTAQEPGPRFIVAEAGLGPALIHYFVRSGVDAEVSIWRGAKHGWVPTDMPVYNKDAAERHWVELIKLFDGVLK